VHELSLAGAIVDTVERHAAGRRVTAVYLRVGHLRQVVPASLAFYFEHVARGTVCEGARLEQELVPAVLRCDAGHEWSLDGPVFRCPVCDSPSSEVVSGEEFMVESIDVTDKEPACTA
jgi:hydrogenase nickel incorporation protein HypA/HybF